MTVPASVTPKPGLRGPMVLLPHTSTPQRSLCMTSAVAQVSGCTSFLCLPFPDPGLVYFFWVPHWSGGSVGLPCTLDLVLAESERALISYTSICHDKTLCSKADLRRKGLFHLAACKPITEEARAGTGAGTTEECWLLACSSWLIQLLFLHTSGLPIQA